MTRRDLVVGRSPAMLSRRKSARAPSRRLPLLSAFGTLTIAVVTAGTIDTPPATRPDESSERELAREIQEKVEQIQRIRERRRRVEESHASQAEEVNRQIDRLRLQLSQARQFAAEQRRTIEGLQQGIADSDRLLTSIRSRLEKLGPAALTLARNFDARVANGPPRDPRGDQAALKPSTLRLESEHAVDAIEEIITVVTAIGKEWQTAASLSLTNEVIDLDGGERQRHVWMLRLGLVSAAWVSEDGSIAGVWSGDASRPWQVDLSSAQREGVQALVDVARGKRPPAVLPIPCQIPPTPASSSGSHPEAER